MTLDLRKLAEGLRIALSQTQVRAEAQRCRAPIALEVWTPDPGSGEKTETLVLWAGADETEPNRRSYARRPILLQASADVWQKVFAAAPPVGFHSLGALRRLCPEFSVTADELTLAQALPFIESLLEQVRAALHSMADAAANDAPADRSGLRFISGRYLQLSNPSRDWVYSEHAGLESGPTLLMLHTAGADARQWHGLMADKGLRNAWRMQAFDLPGHGRSPLPDGRDQWQWQLSEAQYLQWVIAYLDAAKLEQVVILGCSMGAAIGLALLAKHATRFAGAVLLEAPYRSPGRRSPYLNDPEVHGARLSAAWVGSLLSPLSPKSGRADATWIYSQAAPGVYDGDLAFYSDEFDAQMHTAQIDTTKTPVYFLTGDYDYSATPADSKRVADEIAGSQFATLTGFGHFPMVENPPGLLAHLRGPLAKLRERLA